MIGRAARNLLRMLSVALFGLFLAAHAALAAATACTDMPGGQCAAVHAATGSVNLEGDDVAGSQDHASQCQDHCQSMFQPASFTAVSGTGSFPTLAGPHPALFDPGKVIRPPR